MKNESKFLDLISRWWVILAFLVSMIVMWTNLQAQVATNTKNIQTLYAKDQTITTDQNQIQVQLSQIQTDIQWIKTTLSRSTVTLVQ